MNQKSYVNHAMAVAVEEMTAYAAEEAAGASSK